MEKISGRKENNLGFWLCRPGTQKLGMMLDPVPDPTWTDSASQILECLRIQFLTKPKFQVFYNFRIAGLVWTHSTGSNSLKTCWRVVYVQQVLWQMKYCLRMQL